MTALQGSLFAEDTSVPTALDSARCATIRRQLGETLALVEGARSMPWHRLEDIIHAENDFRSAAARLPSSEGDILWSRFDVEMDRLYAIMNEGKELPPPP